MNILIRVLLSIFLFGVVADGYFATTTTSSRRASHTSLSNTHGNIHVQDKIAYPQQTPHAGRHFWPSHPAFKRHRFWKRRRRRFTEGWYYRLTLPEENVSFAFIISIEDPGTRSDLKLACIQVVGPQDTYLVQADRDDTKFWAFQHQQALGCTFDYTSEDMEEETKLRTVLSPEEWKKGVQSGFQVLPNHWMGQIEGHDGSKGGVLPGQGIPGTCEFDFTVEPLCGWGSREEGNQKSTGGWLASYNVFEPHWQVTLADARATGFVEWNNTRYDFVDQPFYAEKNWGAALPSKWYWTQCNSFQGYNQLSVTAGGGVRKVPFGQSESLGMIGIHHDGTFYEAVPWANGFMDWNVTTWGYWNLTGRSTLGDRPFDVEVTYECDPETFPGLVFRAPTPDEGMVYFCRDTFEANVTLSLWDLESDGKEFVRVYPPVIDQARSNQGGAEIGGGPWWNSWIERSQLKPAIRVLLRIPFKFQNIKQKIGKRLLRRRVDKFNDAD